MTNANHSEQTPLDLVSTESLVARLGEADRSAPQAGLEERLFAATRTQFSASDQPAVIGRIGWGSRHALRLAASVGIVAAGVIGATWLAARGPVTAPIAPPTPELATLETDLQQVNTELASMGFSDVAAESTDESTTLDAELAALEDELNEYEWNASFNGVLEESL